jgi:hypothetical protein
MSNTSKASSNQLESKSDASPASWGPFCLPSAPEASIYEAPFILASPRRRLRGLRATFGSFTLSVMVHVSVLVSLAASTAFVTSYNGWQVTAEAKLLPPEKVVQLEPTFKEIPTASVMANVAPADAVQGGEASPEIDPDNLAGPQHPFATVVSTSLQPDILASIQTLVGNGGQGIATAQQGNGQGDNKPSAEFFGITAGGRSFIFVVDCSLSMAGNKWRGACKELTAAIERLSPQQYFYVIFFDGKSHPMFAPHKAATQPMQATPENIQKYREWLQYVKLGYNTSPCLSIKHAVDLNPDAIFLLSDGEFSDPTAAFLRNNNVDKKASDKTPQIAVHTICFHSKDGQKMLERIAAENGGHCALIFNEQNN